MFSSHRTRCPLYYLWEINNGIHIYQFTYELVVVPDLNKIIGGSTDLYRLSYGFEFNLELICTVSFLKNSQVQINFKLNEKNRMITC